MLPTTRHVHAGLAHSRMTWRLRSIFHALPLTRSFISEHGTCYQPRGICMCTPKRHVLHAAHTCTLDCGYYLRLWPHSQGCICALGYSAAVGNGAAGGMLSCTFDCELHRRCSRIIARHNVLEPPATPQHGVYVCHSFAASPVADGIPE